ncbi:MAG: AAA family ATPase [Chloroflexi bacterium]|nr:AAA family ATPase [Chloroflexota bacterium]
MSTHAPDILKDLNDAQAEAVLHTEGPLLIVAGPGSGKTRVVTHRIANLVRECEVSPYRIAAVTFTNKAAREMRERIEGLEVPSADAVFAGTFHAFCSRLLRRHGYGVGLDSNFTIYDAEDQLGLIKQAMELADVDAKNNSPRAMQSIISAAKSVLMDSVSLTRQSQAEGSYPKELAARTYHHYEELLGRSNAVDFDDLLMRAVQLLEGYDEVREEYQRRYQYLMVDEFQDTNIAQYRLAKLLTGPDQNICAVGDPDQSIYSWRNADIRNILSFQKDFPDARVIPLEQNYRSSRNILDAASSLIANNGMRVPKDLRTDKDSGADVVVHEAYTQNEEADFVARQVLDLARRQRIKSGNCAVMYRINSQSRALEEACLRLGIKYRIIGGIQFYRRREIKDLMAYLSVLHNPQDDINLARAVNTPPRGIGEKTIQQVTRWSLEQRISVYDAYKAVARAKAENLPCPAPLAARAYTTVARFGELLARLEELKARLPVSDLIRLVVNEAGLEAHIRKVDTNPEERMENIHEFISLAAEYESESPEDSLAALLERASLVSDVDNYEESEDTLTLITLHQAKGLEFPVVFIVGMEEGLLPHSRSMDSNEELEEERRLCYVGITRAKEQLYLVRAFQRAMWGSSSPTLPSRFLDEIPQDLIAYARSPGAASVSTTSSRTVSRSVEPRSTTARTSSISSLTAWDSPGGASEVAAPEYVPEVGDTVKHDRFGEGIVMKCEEWGSDFEVSVCFDGGELRRLLLSFARLEKV